MDKRHAAAAPHCSLLIRSSQDYFGMYEHMVARLPYESIDSTIAELMHIYETGGTAFVFGNGGSAALASHVACDLGKGTIVSPNGHTRFRVMALTDNVPLLTAWANDSCYENIFAEQLQTFVSPGDVAFAISGSGNSPNVLRGLEVARYRGSRTIGLAGFEGGKMKSLCDICMILPSNNMQIIEDFQLSVTHAIFSVIRQRISARLHTQQITATK